MQEKPLGEWPCDLYSVAQVRELDRILIEEQGIAGIQLMRRAAAACCAALTDEWPTARHVRVYCGSGNNAADGLIVAGMLSAEGVDTDVVIIGDTKKLSEDGQRALAYCESTPANRVADSKGLATPDVIVDALLGTGIKGSPRPEYRAAIQEIEAMKLPVLAVDTPSGLNVDTGAVADIAVKADVTVTFIGMKKGLLTAEGPDYTGRLKFAALGADPAIRPPGDSVKKLELGKLIQQMPRRARNAHKHRFGHVLVVGGDLGMGGAPLMSAMAAMRVGAGLVTLATRKEQAEILMAHRPELMVRGVASGDLNDLLAQASLVVLGPGIGQDQWGQDRVREVLATDLPLIVDADALNLIAAGKVAGPQLKRDNWILTPHPGEATRLAGGENVQQDRFHFAAKLQQQYGGILVLKGAGSLIATSSSMSLCPYGNPGMSSAGMGDVLTGVIGGILAQTGDVTLAAELGVALHSAAADSCVASSGELGLMATDLIPEARKLLNVL